MKSSRLREHYVRVIRALRLDLGLYRVLATIASITIPAFGIIMPEGGQDPYWIRFAFSGVILAILGGSYVFKIVRKYIAFLGQMMIYIVTAWGAWLVWENAFSQGYVVHFLTLVFLAGANFRRFRSWLAYALITMAVGVVGAIFAEGQGVKLWIYVPPLGLLLLFSELAMAFRITFASELDRQRRLVSSIFENSPEAILIANADTLAIRATNQNANRLFGLSGLKTPNSLHSHLSAWLREFLRTKPAMDRGGRSLTTLKSLDGATIIGEVAITEMSTENGPELLVAISDVTEKEQILRHLQLSNDVLDLVDHIVLVADAEAKIIYATPSVKTILGHEVREVLGDGWWDIKRKGGENVEASMAYIKAFARGEVEPKKANYEVRHVDAHGKEQWILWKDSRTPNGLVMGVGMPYTKVKREETLRTMVFSIAGASSRVQSPGEFYQYIHQEIRRLIDTPNFYIAVYDGEHDEVSFPYYKDAEDSNYFSRASRKRKAGKGLTEYGIKARKPVLLSKDDIHELNERGLVNVTGQAIPEVWLGVPLMHDERVVGLITVQNYEQANAYTQEDLTIVSFVASQVAQFVAKLQSDEALRVSEERFRSIYKQAAVGIAQLTPEGSFLQINEKMTEIFGYPAEEMMQMAPSDFTHPDDLDLGRDELIEVMEGKRLSYSKEKRYIHKNGRTVHALLNVSAYREEGVPIFVISVYEDITDKKRAQNETLLLLRLSAALNSTESLSQAVSLTLEELTALDEWEYAEGRWLNAIGEYQFAQPILREDGLSGTGNWLEKVDLASLTPAAEVVWLGSELARPYAAAMEAARTAGAKSVAVLTVAHQGKPIVALLLASRKDPAYHPSLNVLASAVRSQLLAVYLRRIAEEARLESENRYRAITQAAFEGIAIYQGDQILDCNSAFARAFDYEAAEIMDLPLSRLISRVGGGDILGTLAQGEHSGVELIGHKRGGEQVNMEALSRQDQWHGQVARILAVRDITSQKLMEEAREAARLDARFRVYIQNSAEIIKIIDADGIIQYCSPSYDKVFGESSEAVIGWRNEDLVAPEDRNAYAEALARVKQEPDAVEELQLRFPLLDSQRVVQARLTNLIEDPMIKGILISESDITRVIEEQRSRQESEARFRALVEHASEAIFVLDVGEDRLIEANRNASALFGYSRKELLDIDPSVLDAEEDGLTQAKYYGRAIAGELVVYEWVFRNKEGAAVPCEVRLVKFPSATSQLVRASVTDISARKEAEARMLRSRALLRRQNEKLVELAASNALNSGNLDLAFEEITKAISEMLSVTLAGVWLFEQGGTILRCHKEYNADSGDYSSGRVVVLQEFPRYFAKADRERVIAANDARTDEAVAEFLETSILPREIYSTLDAPFRHGGRTAGMVWTMQLHAPREWEAEELNFLASIADLVTLALQSNERKKAEYELANTLTKMRATFDSTRDGILLLDPKGYLLDYNDEFAKLSHVSREELDGGERFPGFQKMMLHIVDPEEFKEAIIRIRKHPENEERYIYQTHEGQVIEMYGRQMLVENELRGTLWFLHDITDLKRVEEALLENETKFRSLFSQANDAIILLDRSTFIECNTKAEEMWGLTREQLLGRKSYELSPEYQPDGELSSEKAARNTTGAYDGEAQRFYWQHLRGDGTPFDAEVSLNRIEIGDQVYIQALVRDITERLKTENALRESERNNKALLDGIPDLILRLTAGGHIIDFKQSDLESHLRLGDDGIGRSVMDVLPRTLASRILEETKIALEQGRSLQFESELKLEGESLDYETRIVRSGHAEVLAIIRDVTERKRTEKELIKRNFELDSFVYRASHDLKAPLNSLMGLISLIETETEDGGVLGYVKMMNKSVVKLDTFIRDLADFSRNARLDLTHEPIDWQALVAETLENLQFADGADRIQKVVNLDCEGLFYSDPVRLGIIFNNLISNAIKYQNLKRNDAEVQISVVAREGKALLTVADNGIGIAKEHQPKVYNLFFRASIQSYGSGMGMYIVKQAIDRVKGQIELESTEGQGTRWTVSLEDLGPPIEEEATPQ